MHHFDTPPSFLIFPLEQICSLYVLIYSIVFRSKIMHKHILTTYLLLSLLSIFSSCEDTLEGRSVRCDQNERFYWENNKAAAQRIAQIM